MKRTGSEEDLTYLINIENLATAEGMLGNIQGQEELLKKSLEIKTRVYGEDHHFMASTYESLATVHGYKREN